jgi:hypothetical protein
MIERPIKDALAHRIGSLETHGASLFEIVVLAMTEVEKIASLSSEEKQEYCVDAVKTVFKLDIGDGVIEDVIRVVVKISRGQYNINHGRKKASALLSCF